MHKMVILGLLALAVSARLAAASSPSLLLAVERQDTHYDLQGTVWTDQALVYVESDRTVEEAVQQNGDVHQPPGGYVLRGAAGKSAFTRLRAKIAAVPATQPARCHVLPSALPDTAALSWRLHIQRGGHAMQTIQVTSWDDSLPACSAAVEDLLLATEQVIFDVAHRAGTTVLSSAS